MHFKQTIVGMSKTESMAQQSLELVSEVASLSARAGPSKEAQPTRLVGRCGLPPAVGVSVCSDSRPQWTNGEHHQVCIFRHMARVGDGFLFRTHL